MQVNQGNFVLLRLFEALEGNAILYYDVSKNVIIFVTSNSDEVVYLLCCFSLIR